MKYASFKMWIADKYHYFKFRKFNLLISDCKN